ncbi:MAG: hypothetical protein O7D91_18335 [Planctomycetota bacterium]|nr:hypothetical protein [Planctomycetota bacterium]
MRNTVNTTMVDINTSPVGGVRRRGNVMLFVIFILGTLFAASMAFLALMRTEAGVMSSRRDQDKLDVIIGGLSDDLMLNSVTSLMGQGLLITGGNRVPYVQDVVDANADGVADRSDSLSSFATIPGVHHLVASNEPYDPGTGVLEWFAVSDPYRAWDDRVDVHANPINSALPVEPSLPATRPLRIRPLNGIGLLPPYDYIYDTTDDSFTLNWGLSDADGDGVVDSVRHRVALLGGGEADWGLAGLGGTDDTTCSGVIDVPFTGAPSFTDPTGPLTPLPCDDFDGNGILDFGTLYPQSFRRAIAAKLRDPDPAVQDDLDDLYFSLRLIQNGGMANLGYSHRALIDNLFGKFGSGPNDLTAANMMNLPYGPAVEQALRRRGLLAPLRWSDPLATLGPLGEDMLADDGRDGPLYKTLFEALIIPQSGPPEDLQWFPVLDEPGGNTPEDIYDLDWAGRWMNPNRWNDLNDSAGAGNADRHYDIAHNVTTVSTGDMLMRNGKFGAGLLTGAMPTYDPTIDGWVDAGGVPYSLSTDTAIQMYPAYDVNHNPATGVGDPSFIDPTTGLPKVPLPVMNAAFGYGRPRDAGGTPSSDIRYAGMQFALHSIGNINAPTQREIQTVQDYFTVMLRNVTVLGPPGPDGIPGTPDDQDLIHDQAAQLTANFIDFADFDSGASPFAGLTPGGRWDYPTIVQSRSGKFFAGMENQPFISEVYVKNPDEGGVELFYPHAIGTLDLGTLGYGIRVIKNGGVSAVHWLPMVTEIIGQTQRYIYYANAGFSGAGPRGNIDIDEIRDLGTGGIVQLIRRLPNGNLAVVDEVTLNDPALVPPASFNASMQRDTFGAAGWRATVPQYRVTQAYQTLGSVNDDNGDRNLRPDVAPVHATTDSLGLEAAYPTTGSLLLLMQHANEVRFDPDGMSYTLPPAKPMTFLLTTGFGNVDNGHMPVFDVGQVAQGAFNGPQPMDGTTGLSIPWGQLVFDYFTALAFDNQFNPLADPPLFAAPQEPGNGPDGGAGPGDDVDGDLVPWEYDFGYQGFIAYLRANQPTVELGGVRVHGRININAAPWKVLDGLPLMHPKVMPIYKHLPVDPAAGGGIETLRWRDVLPYPTGAFPGPLGDRSFTPTGNGAGMTGPVVEKLGVGKAKGIVAYRELRELPDPTGTWASRTTGNYNTLMPNSWRYRSDGSTNFLANTTQRHTAGFLTVGELANVRLPRPGDITLVVTDAFSQMDNGQSYDFPFAQNYLFAVAPLVALGDWVTVKGHTFTAYGVLTGQGEVAEVNRLAERFEMVFDRSNLLISDDPAERPEVIYKVREPLSAVNPN